MKLFFEFDEEENQTNIGIAKALTERIQDYTDLYEIAKHLMVYCEARSNEVYRPQLERKYEKEGVE